MSHSVLADFDKIVHAIYRAALSPYASEGWSQFVEDVSHLMGGSLICLHSHDAALSKGIGLLSSQVDPEFLRDYGLYYSEKNVWARPMLCAPVGVVVQSEDIYPTRDLMKTEYYNDYLIREDLVASVGVTIRKKKSSGIYLSGNMRGHNAEEVSARIALMFELIGPHIARAFDVMRSINIASARGDLVLAAEQSPDAVFILDRKGRLVHENRIAGEVRKTGNLLVIDVDGRLSLLDKAAQAKLSTEMTALLKQQMHTLKAGGFPISTAAGLICRAVLTPVPYGAEEMVLAYAFDEHPALVLTISGPSIADRTAARLAKYRLSPAEAALALAIADGLSPNQYAQTRGVSIHTVRSQLKSLFMKTGVNRQSQLGALLRS